MNRLRRHLSKLRWLLLLAAVAIVVVFLLEQQQTTGVTYGNAPAGESAPDDQDIPSRTVALPSVDAMTAMVRADNVVRLPGSIAQWDTARVQRSIGSADVRILVTPPGLTSSQERQVYDVADATIRVLGTRVSGGAYEVSPSTLVERRDEFARNDITAQLIRLIDALDHRPQEPDPPSAPWRAPTDAELNPVVAVLDRNGFYAAPGAQLSSVPTKASAQAFATDRAWFVALPTQPIDKPAPDFGAALTARFPDRPIVVMYGYWAQYYGPHAADFAELAGATFYGQYGETLSDGVFEQGGVLGAYLSQVTTIRYAGLFDRPLPYRTYDPLRVALPVLPWLFAACVVGFLALSARSILRPPTVSGPRGPGRAAPAGLPARLAGLTALAVEVSPLTGEQTDPALTRAISELRSAREALRDKRPERQIRSLLDAAERELDSVGRRLPLAGYRPHDYLRGRLG